MRLTILNILVIGIILATHTGCSNISQSEYNSLMAENDSLKTEIQHLKFGADKLLSQAKSDIDSKKFVAADTVLQKLIKLHPGSPQVIEAKKLLIVAADGIKAQKITQEKAKFEKEKAVKDRLANATRKMRIKVDDMNDITWYYDRNSPQYTNYNGFYAYIGTQKGSKPWLRLVIQYVADDWLFIDNYIIKVDEKTFKISEDGYGEIKTDNSGGEIWEWLDRKVGYSEYEIIKAVANGKNVKIRFNGKDYYKDKTISVSQKVALRNVLDAYEALGGTNSF